MWRKSEEPAAPAVTPTPTAAASRSEQRKEVATIGPSIAIKGDLTGNEDLVIQGRLEGEVKLKQNNITVGQSGRVKADIYGRSIRVEGEVRGNLYGEQEVVIRASGRVNGNIVSPRVTLENGSNFKGSIDMEAAKQPAVSQPGVPKKGDRAPTIPGAKPGGAADPQRKIVAPDRTPASQ